MNEIKDNLAEQILTKAQLKKVVKILKTAEPDHLHRELVTFLSSIKPPLEEKGMHPPYLAYWFEWKKKEFTHHR